MNCRTSPTVQGESMKFYKLIAACTAVTILAGCGVSEGRYKEVQGLLAKPERQKAEIGHCSNMFGNMPMKSRQNMAVISGLSVSSMPTILCKRLVQGIVSGKLTPMATLRRVRSR
eukprot:gene8208-10090_t